MNTQVQITDYNVALEAFGLDRAYELKPVRHWLPEGGIDGEPTGVNLVVDATTGRHLHGVSVGDGYRIIPNSAYAYIGEVLENCTYTDGGWLKGGRVSYLQVSFDARPIRPGDDIVEQLTLLNAVDGSLGFKIVPGALRIFCDNQIPYLSAMAKQYGYTVRHTKNHEKALHKARHAMVDVHETQKRNREYLRALTQVRLSDREAESIVIDIVGPMRGDGGEEYTQAQKDLMRDLERTYFSAPTEDLPGTAYAMHNAITAHGTHQVATGGRTVSPTESLLVGRAQAWMVDALATMNQRLGARV